MKLSRVYARFYKSFNFDNVRKVAGQAARGEWEIYGGRRYPFVEVPLNARITAVVGANESGKSHLLGAINRGITGTGFTDRDLCRYSDFFGVEAGAKHWPHIGLNWTHLTPAESEELRSILGLDGSGPKSFLMFRYGPDVLHVWLTDKRQEKFELDAEQAGRLTALLPQPLTIDPNIALPGAVPLRWLADPNTQPPDLGNRRQRAGFFEAAGRIAGLVSSNADSITNNAASLHGLLWPVAERAQSGRPSQVSPEQLKLTRSLLFDMAHIDQDSFRILADAIADAEDGLANAVTEKINEQIERSLNFRRWWVQDRDFSLRLSTREHEVVFTIRDRTGTEYTFDERSSGLKYFLSYLIQSQAGRAAGSDRILLMDEPDAHLSAEAQQDLLRIFADLAEPLAQERPPIQVVYVTHSPFLLDKNHADRIRVLEKGRGLDGTRVISGAAHNHYEPLRSAFGAFVGETAFVGAVNLLVEGTADQILLAGAARAIRDDGPAATADTLDLNGLVIVPCGSAQQVEYVTYLVRGRGDNERPAVVALLDSDDEGRGVARRMLEDKKFRKLVAPEFILQLGDLGLREDGVVTELEDLVPPALAVEAANRSLAEIFRFLEGDAPAIALADMSDDETRPLFDRLKDALHAKGGSIGKVPFARAVVEVVDDPTLSASLRTSRTTYLKAMKMLFRKLNEVRRDAQEQSRRVRNAALVADRVKMFELDHPANATGEEVDHLLIAISGQIDDSNEAEAIRTRMQELRAEYRLREDPMAPIVDFPGLLEQLRALKSSPAILQERAMVKARVETARQQRTERKKAEATAAKPARKSSKAPAAAGAPKPRGRPARAPQIRVEPEPEPAPEASE